MDEQPKRIIINGVEETPLPKLKAYERLTRAQIEKLITDKQKENELIREEATNDIKD